MPPAVFEPVISEDGRPQTHALDRAATLCVLTYANFNSSCFHFCVWNAMNLFLPRVLLAPLQQHRFLSTATTKDSKTLTGPPY